MTRNTHEILYRGMLFFINIYVKQYLSSDVQKLIQKLYLEPIKTIKTTK